MDHKGSMVKVKTASSATVIVVETPGRAPQDPHGAPDGYEPIAVRRREIHKGLSQAGDHIQPIHNRCAPRSPLLDLQHKHDIENEVQKTVKPTETGRNRPHRRHLLTNE